MKRAIRQQELKEKLKRRFSSYGGSFTRKLRQSLASRGNINSGDLSKSVKTRSAFKWSENRYVLVVEMLAYGNFLNKNLKPNGYPNVDAIHQWIIDKGIKPKNGIRDTKGLAFVIARSIKKNGFATYNKNRVGWADLIIQEEIKRLKGRARKDLRDLVRSTTIEMLDFNKD